MLGHDVHKEQLISNADIKGHMNNSNAENQNQTQVAEDMANGKGL